MDIFIKMCGAVITVLGTTIYGWLLTRQMQHRINRLTSYKESLLMMSGHIRYAKQSMPVILKDISENIQFTEIKAIYANVLLQIEDNEGKTFWDMWRAGVDESFKMWGVKDEIILYYEAGELPLYMDKDMQLQFLEERITRIDERMCRLKNELAGKEKVYKSLGLASGLLIVLVLL